MEKKNLIVGQSGGPTAVINSSLYGVVSEGIKQEEIEHVYGMINGIEGFLKGTILDFEEALPGEKLKYLTYTQALTWAPAAISFRNLWKIRYTQSFSANLRR